MQKDHYLKTELDALIHSDSSIFEFLQNGSLDGLWYWDLENPEQEWMNDRFWEVLGQNPKEKKHLSSEWQNLIYQDDLNSAIENLQKHLKDPKYPYDQIVRYLHKDGSTVWIRCRGIAIRDESNKPIRMLGAHNDITEIMKSKELLSQILDASMDGVMAFRSLRDDEGVIVDFIWTLSNDRACEIVKLPQEALIGKPLLQVMPGNKEAGLFDAYVQVVESGEPMKLEFHFDHDGITEWFANKAVKLGDGFVVTFSVITEEKRKQDEILSYQKELEQRVEQEVRKQREQEALLIQQSKLAAMGEMISMIAHQWRQPLNVASLALGAIEMLMEDEKIDRERVLKHIQKSFDNINYMSQTIEDFRNYYKDEMVEAREFQIKEAMLSALELVESQLINHNIKATITNATNATLLGSQNQFKQLFLTIISNAKDAIEDAREKGMLERSEAGLISIEMQESKKELLVCIMDNGVGLDESIKNRVFEPYFTTKHSSVGTGIGLYMAKTILERYFGGEIYLKNGTKGAICEIRLPN